MWRVWVSLLVVGCAKDEPPPTVSPVKPGTLRGTATSSAIPGVPPPQGQPSSSYPTTEPCEIVVTARSGQVARTKSDAKGAFELSLPPGPHIVDFVACRRNCMLAQGLSQEIVIASGQVTQAVFHCEGSNP